MRPRRAISLSFSGYDCIASPDNCFQSPEAISGPIAKGYAARLKGVFSCSYHYYGEGFPRGLLPRGCTTSPLSALAEWSWDVQRAYATAVCRSLGHVRGLPPAGAFRGLG